MISKVGYSGHIIGLFARSFYNQSYYCTTVDNRVYYQFNVTLGYMTINYVFKFGFLDSLKPQLSNLDACEPERILYLSVSVINVPRTDYIPNKKTRNLSVGRCRNCYCVGEICYIDWDPCCQFF